MLYRSTDRLSRRGAPVKNLAHNASFQLLEKIAPSNPGIKHLVNVGMAARKFRVPFEIARFPFGIFRLLLPHAEGEQQ
jgi:hypothetical protein